MAGSINGRIRHQGGPVRKQDPVSKITRAERATHARAHTHTHTHTHSTHTHTHTHTHTQNSHTRVLSG
jgi:hypothetical protein